LRGFLQLERNIFYHFVLLKGNRLFDLANNFQKMGGKFLFIDEVHKYDNWSQEIKNIYDSFPDLL